MPTASKPNPLGDKSISVAEGADGWHAESRAICSNLAPRIRPWRAASTVEAAEDTRVSISSETGVTTLVIVILVAVWGIDVEEEEAAMVLLFSLKMSDEKISYCDTSRAEKR